MSDVEPPQDGPDEADLLAGEYVLGVLDGPTRERAAERARRDPVFAAAVDAWQRRLTPLIDQIGPVTPPERVWAGVVAAVAAEAIRPASNVVSLTPRARVWDRVGPWRAATAGSLAAALALALFILFRPAQTPLPAATASAPAPPQVATLATSTGKALFVATLDPIRRTATIVPVGALRSAGRAPELWIIPSGAPPRPVGLIAAARTTSMSLGTAVLAGVGGKAQLAVSLEPPGGSPSGLPTGPVVATGPLSTL